MAAQIRTGLDWDDLRVFLALGRRGSLSAAARSLSVNHATIARRIQSLEHSLGEKLVERRPDGYVLTKAGARVLTAAGDMEAIAETVDRSSDDGSLRGLVRINAPPSLAQAFLIARLSELAALHPGLDVDLAIDMRAISLERREADVAVRLGRPRDGDVIARHVATAGFGFYGTPAACDRVEAGGELVAIGFDEASAHLPEALWLAREFPDARLMFRTSDQFSQARAALTGGGLSVLPHYVGRLVDGLRLSSLRPVPPPREIVLLTRRSSRHDVPVRAVVDHLAAAFEAEQALFE